MSQLRLLQSFVTSAKHSQKLSQNALFAAKRSLSTRKTSIEDKILSNTQEDSSLRQILTPGQSLLLDNIKNLLEEIPQHLNTLGLSREDAGLLESASSALEELFLVVVVGEFNAGKSNFINALLGAKHCKTGVLPTTETVQILQYGPQREECISLDESKAVRTIKLPVDWLKRASIVDTPGTNAVLRAHQEITEKFVPSADLILFITSVERPFSESEKQFLSRIYDWKKKVVVVLNKADLVVHDMEAAGIVNSNASATAMGSQHEDGTSSIGPSGIDINAVDTVAYADGTPEILTSFDQVVSFVRANAKTVLQESPPVFGVSSRLALAGKMAIEEAQTVLSGDNNTSHSTTSSSPRRKMSPASAAAAIAQGRALVANSGFSDLERHVLEELTAENKVRLKMENPLSVAEHLLKKYSTIFESRSDIIKSDAQIRDVISRELEEFTNETRNDVQRDLTKIENVFLRMKAETTSFTTQQFRLSNVFSMITNMEFLRKNYDERVNRGVADEIEAIVSNVSNWVVAKTTRQSQTLAAIMQRGASSKPIDTTTTSTPAPTPISPSSDVNDKNSISPVNNVSNSGNALIQAERVRTVGMDHQQSRLHILQELQKQVRVLMAEDRRVNETQKMMERIRIGALGTISVEILAMLIASTEFLVPGLLGATWVAPTLAATVALSGLSILPALRIKATKNANVRTDELYNSLRAMLALQFNREIEDSSRMLKQATTPYCKYVQHEEENTLKIQQRFHALRGSIHRIRKEMTIHAPSVNFNENKHDKVENIVASASIATPITVTSAQTNSTIPTASQTISEAINNIAPPSITNTASKPSQKQRAGLSL